MVVECSARARAHGESGGSVRGGNVSSVRRNELFVARFIPHIRIII